MRYSRALRHACIAAIIGVVAAAGVAGCAASRHRDWREAVKAGDYQHAYLDLFETWRAGTPDVKAEALRSAWRVAGITAVARKDLAAIIQPAADRHAGDLASLQKSIVHGPLEDRVDFAKLVDRTIDVEREIAAAYAKRDGSALARPAVPAAPAAVARPAEPVAAPVASQAPVAAPPAAQSAPMPQATKKTPVAEAPRVAETPSPAREAKPAQAAAPSESPSPATAATPGPARKEADAVLSAKVEEAKQRATWRCKGAPACGKSWEAAESFVGRNSDMRIKTVTGTLIDTYPPIVIGEIGMKVERIALGADESEMRLTVSCRVGRLRQSCPAAELRIYTAFPAFMRSAAAP